MDCFTDYGKTSISRKTTARSHHWNIYACLFDVSMINQDADGDYTTIELEEFRSLATDMVAKTRSRKAEARNEARVTRALDKERTNAEAEAEADQQEEQVQEEAEATEAQEGQAQAVSASDGEVNEQHVDGSDDDQEQDPDQAPGEDFVAPDHDGAAAVS